MTFPYVLCFLLSFSDICLREVAMERNWKQLLHDSIRDAQGLALEFGFSPEERSGLEALVKQYPVCINPYYLSLIHKDDPDDPIRKMAVPDLKEFNPGGSMDTSGEADNTVVQGMQHKYRQTALILSTNQCAMYCRHCFRKRLVGLSDDEVALHIPEMVSYVKKHTEINNILISGGDAFMNTTATLRRYLEAFSVIEHIEFIRFGTRVPVVLPQRIYEDGELFRLLQEFAQRKPVIIVTQFNHPREITRQADLALKALRSSGCIIRNQTVLLKGVNDAPDVLGELLNRLVAHGVIPYYIFQCRPVSGVKNQFQVPLLRGSSVVEEAKALISGQAKSVRYAMSHPTGKIEILGPDPDGDFLFRYHQAKSSNDASRMFSAPLLPTHTWLDQDLAGMD